MKEFCAVPHGAGKNFLGALQSYITGELDRSLIVSRIQENNLFDSWCQPVHFVESFHPRTNWNKQLIECQSIAEKLLYKRIEPKTAEQQIRTLVNSCHEGSFCFGYTIPHVNRYSLVMLTDNPIQRVWLDDLAMLKKEGVGPDPTRVELAERLFRWEIENLANYRTEWAMDYTSFFLVKHRPVIQEFIDRTVKSRSCRTLVTTRDLQELIELYSAKNEELLERYD